MPELFRVAHHIDRVNASAANIQADALRKAVLLKRQEAGIAIDPGEALGHRLRDQALAREALIEACDLLPSRQQIEGRRTATAAVSMKQHVLRKEVAQRLKIPLPRGAVEGRHDRCCFCWRHREAALFMSQIAPSTYRQLPAGGLTAIEQISNLHEIHLENVVQQEGDALERRQALQRQKKRSRMILGESRFLSLFDEGDERFWQPWPDVFLPPHSSRLQMVKAKAGDHTHKESTGVLHGRARSEERRVGKEGR